MSVTARLVPGGVVALLGGGQGRLRSLKGTDDAKDAMNIIGKRRRTSLAGLLLWYAAPTSIAT